MSGSMIQKPLFGQQPMPSPYSHEQNASLVSSSWQMSSDRFIAPSRKSTDSLLQKQFPGHYARLTTRKPLSDTVRNVKQTTSALDRLQDNLPVKDYQLAVMSDQTKMASSLAIATLATLGLKQKVFGVGEFLGFTSWFGAMAATPKIINGMVQWKTGVNLNQRYDSTYGQRLNLFTDPHYLPLHILPDAVINRAADKLGIPNGPNRRQQTEEKMRQISVQSRTWWMLMAGPATPVISGLICDTLQNPLMRVTNTIKAQVARAKANFVMRSPKVAPDKAAHYTHAYLDQLVGELPESTLSGWWQSFGQGIIDKTNLALGLSIQDVVKASRNEQIEKILVHFKDHPPTDAVFDFLNEQYWPGDGNKPPNGKLEDLRRKAEEYLESAKKRIQDPALMKEQQRLIDDRILNAESTVNHYRNFLTAIRNKAPEKEIRALMTDANINAIQQLLNEGHFEMAEKLVGDSHIFQKIGASIKNEARQFNRAFTLMGATPEKHLLDEALKNMKLGNLWRRRMGLYLGGSMLAATALYSYFFVGKDFQAPRSASEKDGLFL
jgi:hypothetical protein